jgi:hypothetical protein
MVTVHISRDGFPSVSVRMTRLCPMGSSLLEFRPSLL